MAASTIELTAGEVLEVIYTDDNPELVYGVKVKILDNNIGHTPEDTSVITAVPLNFSYIRLPIVGEMVLIMLAPSSYTHGLRHSVTAYYLDIISLQFNIHNNALPTATKIIASKNISGNSAQYNEASSGNSNQTPAPAVDVNFSENSTVKSLQPYVGDVIISGRYGNSIRLSATPKSGNFKVPANFSNAIGLPIAIYRNTKQSTDTQKINDFITEDFNAEENIIVQASGQELVFEQASLALTAANQYNVTSWQTENWGTTPQTLISSGRIIFNSTQKEIIAFAKNGIGLSSETAITIDAKNTISLNAGLIELGTGSDEQLILGTSWKVWMDELIEKISTITPISPVGPCSPLSESPQWPEIESLKAQIESKLLSEVAFTKKTASGTDGSGNFALANPNFTATEAELVAAENSKEISRKALDQPLTEAEKAAHIDSHNNADHTMSKKEMWSTGIDAYEKAKEGFGYAKDIFEAIKKFKKR